MATLSYRKHRLNATGEYDTIYTETSSEIVMRPNGSSVESAIQSLANSKLNKEVWLQDDVDLNTVLDSGIYRIQTCVNGPSTQASYSTMFVARHSTADTFIQIIGNWSTNELWYRAGVTTTVSDSVWKRAVVSSGDTMTGTYRITSVDGDKIAPNGDDTFLVTIDNGVDTNSQSGLSVRTRWGSTDSVIFEACRGWNGSTNGYFPAFRVDGCGRARSISANVTQDVGDSYFRNIKGTSNDPGSGSTLTTGDIVLVYE